MRTTGQVDSPVWMASSWVGLNRVASSPRRAGGHFHATVAASARWVPDRMTSMKGRVAAWCSATHSRWMVAKLHSRVRYHPGELP